MGSGPVVVSSCGADDLDHVLGLQAEMAEVCGIINAATARLSVLVEGALADGSWQQTGIHSPEHWLAWQCGLSPASARRLVATARRRGELPATMARFDTGALSADQVAAVVRFTPAVHDGEVAEFAEKTTVSQLRRTLSKYGWDPQKKDPVPKEEKRECSFGSDDDGTWHMHVNAPPDEGAKLEAGLAAMRKELVGDAPDPEARRAVTWLDALMALFDRAAENDDAKVLGRRKRHLVNIHIQLGEDGEWTGHLHLGPILSRAVMMYQSCDAAIRPIMEHLGLPVSVGRTVYTVPDRTRLVVENRDRGCRIHGCNGKRVEVHHIIHWTDHGTTDTFNLVCLCPKHHRLHHLGIGITGNADLPGGLVFTDQWGWVIADSGRAQPPGAPPGQAATQAHLPWAPYTHGTGEPLQTRSIMFNQPHTPAA